MTRFGFQKISPGSSAEDGLKENKKENREARLEVNSKNDEP